MTTFEYAPIQSGSLSLWLCEWKKPPSTDLYGETSKYELAVIWARSPQEAELIFKDEVVNPELWLQGKVSIVESRVPAMATVVYSHGGYED